MAARASWSGAIEFAGFPINVRFYPRVKSRSGESFKLLSPAGAPVVQRYLDPDENAYEKGELGRGYQVARGDIRPLDDDALEMIASAERSGVLEPERVCPRSEVDLTLARDAYVVIPDDKVPGSDKPVGILWNGLRANEQVMILPGFTARAGSRDSVCVLHADDEGLYASTLPLADELHTELPAVELTHDEEAEGVFAMFCETVDLAQDTFDLAAYESAYKQRRQAAIDAALKGEKVEVPEVAQAKEAVPDLMAAMQAATAGKKRQSKGGKQAKPKAKAAA